MQLAHLKISEKVGKFGETRSTLEHIFSLNNQYEKIEKIHEGAVLYQFALKNFQNMNIYLFYVQKITSMLSSLLIQIMN